MKHATSLDTILTHTGHTDSWPAQMPTAPALFPSTSFLAEIPEALDAPDVADSEDFPGLHHGNPTVDAFAAAVRQLEGGSAAEAFASGLAALDAALYAIGLKPGDALLLSRDLDEAALSLCEEIWGEIGVTVETVDVSDLAATESALFRLHPQGLVLETLSNPLMTVPDLPRVIEKAHAVGCHVVVDNTFATPVLLKPLASGADLVIHSATMFLGGHGDAAGGVVVGHAGYAARLARCAALRGSIMSPFDAWLLLRGLKTLGVRFERQSRNAARVAEKLRDSGCFNRVVYPGLSDHPSHEAAKSLFSSRGFGAVVTIDVPGAREQALRLLSRLRLIGTAPGAGDVHTLCLSPALTPNPRHGSTPRHASGISDTTLRIAVGLESADDIVADLLQALE